MSALDKTGYQDKLEERLKTINYAIKLLRGAMRNYKEGPRILPDGSIHLHGPLTKEAQILVNGWENAKRIVESKLSKLAGEPADKEFEYKEYKAPKKTNPNQQQEKKTVRSNEW